MKNDNVRAVDVYVESRRAREHAGRLERDTDPGGRHGFRFTYNDAYLQKSDAVSIGPELPLICQAYLSGPQLTSFADRIPSKANPAYPEYCAATGISENESDPFVLLTTIGKRGPSCFVFEPVQEDRFGPEDAAEFRAGLGLSLREFGRLFDFSPFTIQKIESGKQTGRDVLKRMELYTRFPETAWFEMNRNRAKLHTNQWKKLEKLYIGEILAGTKKKPRD